MFTHFTPADLVAILNIPRLQTLPNCGPPVDHACLPEKTNYSTFKLRGGAGEVIE